MGVPEIGIGGSGEQGAQVGIGIFRILQNGKYVGDPGTAPAGMPASVFQPVLQGILQASVSFSFPANSSEGNNPYKWEI